MHDISIVLQVCLISRSNVDPLSKESDGKAGVASVMTNAVTLKTITYPSDPNTFQQCLDVRIKVFCNEQKFPIEIEKDHHDELATTGHVVASLDNQVIGTCRVIKNGEFNAQLGRLAILQSYRGNGLSRPIIETTHAFAKNSLNANKIEAHAQWDKQAFYKKMGYIILPGDEQGFIEDGAKHIRMVRDL